jgi:hypothetical protein
MAGMPMLSSQDLTAYRAETYRLRPDLRVLTREQAIDFVNQRGFVHFWPIQGVTLPSLWAAVAGERPVPNEHDDPGHVTWGWKDELLGARRWYYAKVLRKKATFIALDAVPYFYALSENYGEPEQDYLLQYQEGGLTFEAKAVYETLLGEGPLDSISLRKLARLGSKESETRFNRALELLQADFKILPVGVAQAGAWKYAFIYDLVHRFYPDLPQQARPIRQIDARRKLAELYLLSVGAAPEKALASLFGWPKGDAETAVSALVQDGLVVKDIQLADQPGRWVALSRLMQA